MDWELIAWAALLVAQNAAFTLVSRARNSKSIMYHALASLPSNGVWFLSQFFLFGQMMDAFAKKDLSRVLLLGIWYTMWTMVGSIGMHYIALHKLEKGRNV